MPLVPPDPRLIGRWTRTLLETADGPVSTAVDVTWLQAGSLYVDLRLPRNDPGAGAEGFAGRLLADGPWACWQRIVDLQPTGAPDEGRLDVAGDGTGSDLVETGRDGSYREHWHRAATPIEPLAAVLLAGVDDDQHTAVVVRVGDDIGWARGRSRSAAAQELPDTEVSMARVGGGIERSNLPWRVGCGLGLRIDGDRAYTEEVVPDGRPVARTWRVVAGEGDLADLVDR